MSKYDIKQRVLADLPDFEDKKAKFASDVAAKIDWKPTFSRIKILPDAEQLSAIIDTSTKRDTLIRGTIVAIGPDVGKRDGRHVENFWVGQKVLYISNHVMTYAGADGVKHHFLKENSDVSSIIAVEPAKEAIDEFGEEVAYKESPASRDARIKVIDALTPKVDAFGKPAAYASTV